ncbi:MAG: relaxase/mobilization nuclease domain-containing protein [Solobacterium sp.]|nr:relaxase/mobilization nuclease domain-containing protein [Solobacterium sp.]
MAATKLISMHQAKGKSPVQSLKDRINYSENPDKTEEGQYISSYACSAETAAEEFALSKEEYLRITGRVYKGDILAYQIRQSFKPGEITPEEANKVGYETAMRFTRGEHAFIVCTHTDRAHIHNHIIFNSVTLDCTRKFKNFFFCGLALQTLSDIVCFEHGKSIIQKLPVGQRKKRTVYPQRHSFRDVLRSQINEALQKKPRSMEAFLSSLEQSGYQIKRGKHIAVKGHGQKRFVRLDSLGDGFSQLELEALISGKNSKRCIREKEEQMDLLINMQDKILEGKGAGYQRWAEKFNVKQMAKVLLFLQENNIHDMKDLRKLASEASKGADGLFDTIHAKDERPEEIRQLKNHIFNYSKTRGTYEEYRRSGYDPQYLEEHTEEIRLHEQAKAVFDQLPDKKIPKVKDLNTEYSQILSEKKKAYAEYRTARNKAKELQIALKNAEIILEEDREQTNKRSRKNQRDQSH